MVWLVAHMWLALAGAAILGILFGWASRGIRARGTTRIAEVERDVVKTELEQAKTEIDSLYAAQRSANGSAPVVKTLTDKNSLSGELDERERKLEDLTKELAQSKEQLSSLKSAATAAAVTTSTDPARLDANLNLSDASLQWRNRYLESRVRSLETQVHETGTGTIPITAGPDTDLTPTVSNDEEPPTASDGEETPEQELARLRWRNRYLEGRVAYHEGGEDEVSETVSNGNGHGGLAAAAGAAVTTALRDEVEPEASAETPADAVLRAMEKEEASAIEAVEPETLKTPRDKTGDDLTVISGIGPKIQEVLHGMGVFHYDQIAGWSAGNTAWVDQQLQFSGRIEREDWVTQAKTHAEKVSSSS